MLDGRNLRILASCVLSFVLAFGIVGGSLAYLQDSTDVVENVFTHGEINIALTEAVVDELGVAASPASRTSSAQTYRLVSGHSYVKDPVVTVEADSEPAYVYLLVDNPISALEDTSAGTIASQISSAGWSTLTASSGGLYYGGHPLTATQTLYYKAVSSSSSDQNLGTFTSLNIDLWADVTTAAGLSIDLTAFAVQQDNFATATAAWEATFGDYYDPTVDYDFGTRLEATSIPGGVNVEKSLGGSSCRLELSFYNSLAGSGYREPVFISNYICITVNGSGATRLWVRDSTSGNSYLHDEFGVDGTWRLVAIGGFNQSFTVVAEGPNVWVNGTLKVSNAECYGWGDYEPLIFGKNPAGGDYTTGYFYWAKLYTDGDLTMDLSPAKRKTDGAVGVFDSVENLFYQAFGGMKIKLPSS